MSSIRTTLSEDNMDLVMDLVRSLNVNPSQVLNYLLDNPDEIISARSRLKNGENKRKS